MPIRLRTTDRLFARYCKTGDPRALGRVFDRTAAHLLHVAAWLAGNRHDAEDLLQRTFLTAILDRASFARERAVLPWLAGILTNHARNLRRERVRRRALPAGPEPIDDPVARAVDRELSDAVALARAEIGSPYREVLELHLEQGLDAGEIAAQLGRPAGTVRTQVVRALELLRRRLPSGFVAGFAPVAVEPSALAAMKAQVLAAASGVAPVPVPVMAGAATTVVATGGVLMAKKLVLVVPVLALLLGVAIYSAWPGTEVQQPPPAEAQALTARVDHPTETAANATAAAPEPSSERQPVATPAEVADPGFASLRVLVRWQHDGAPASSVGVSINPKQGSQLLCRFALTDAAGVALLRHIVPGPYWMSATHVENAPDVALVADQQETIELQAERVCMVRGRVVDHDGLPVAGASICVAGRESALEIGRGDAGGRFAVPLLRTLFVMARKPGHVPSHSRFLRAEAGKDLDVELALRGVGGTVRGTVRDPGGKAIAWANVLVGLRGGHVVPSSSPDIQLMMPYPDRAVTGADGAFVVEGVPPGDSELRAWAIGSGPVQQAIQVRAGETTELAITLAAGCTVAGVVRDADGQAVAKAIVQFGEEFEYFPAAVTVTGEDGRFRMADLPSGDVRLSAAKETSKATATLALLAGTTTEWNPVLGKGRTITGTVLGPLDLPFAGAKVGTVHFNYQQVMRWVETDAAGRFELTNVGDKPVSLQVASEGATLVEMTKVAPDRRDVVLRVSARDLPTARLRGRIVDALGRATTGSVFARRQHITNGESQQLDKDTGGFAFEPTPAGEYELSAWVEGYGQIPLGTVVLEPGQERVLEDVVMQVPGEVELTVLDAAGGLVDAKHTGIRTAAGFGMQGCEIRRGKGRLGSLQPGRYFFESTVARGQVARAEFEVKSGATTQVEARGCLAMPVTIRFRDPEPATPGLAVEMRFTTAEGRLAGFAETYPGHRDPLQQVVRLPLGVFRIECHASDGRRAEAELTIRSLDDRPELTIDLPRR